uniref:Uncharacterized protein n=1 Tax=Tanacetum cinerariifolium TaxID=118510 RepID=A0A6L2N7T4_TANCI|nr:hypothetical protein [Tanacetum cinerariifolium]
MPPPKPKKTQKPRQPKRKTTKVPHPSESTNIAANEAVHKEGMIVWHQDTMRDTSAHTRYKRVSKMSSDSLLAGVNTTRSDEDSLKHIELMKICTTLQKKVLDIEDELKRTKTAQQTKINGLEMRVKKLEKKHRSRTLKLKRLYKVGLTARVISSSDDEALDKEDASKQGRTDEIDADEDIALVSTHDNTQDVVWRSVKTLVDPNMIDLSSFKSQHVGEEEVFEVVTTAKMLIDTVVDVAQVMTAIVDILVSVAVTIVTTTPTITAESTKTHVEYKGKGKVKLIKETVKLKKKDQILFDEKVARKLQEEIYEQERLVGERTRQEKEANSALTETWEYIQAKVYVDYQLAETLQEEEQEQLKDDEKAKLFMELLEKRRKTELVEESSKKDEAETTQESSSKRAGDELDPEKSKKQKVEDDKESEELKKCLEIILDDGDD